MIEKTRTETPEVKTNDVLENRLDRVPSSREARMEVDALFNKLLDSPKDAGAGSLEEIDDNEIHIMDFPRDEKMPEGSFKNPIHLDTINEEYNGKCHEKTGVLYIRRIEKIGGLYFEGIYPVFPSICEVRMAENFYRRTDYSQFKECDRQLKEAVNKDPELRKQFTPEQLQQIEEGETPDGYTWHHDIKPGRMQLVSTELHSASAHKGGRHAWGPNGKCYEIIGDLMAKSNSEGADK